MDAEYDGRLDCASMGLSSKLPGISLTFPVSRKWPTCSLIPMRLNYFNVGLINVEQCPMGILVYVMDQEINWGLFYNAWAL